MAKQEQSKQPATVGVVKVLPWPAPLPVNDAPSDVTEADVHPAFVKQLVGSTRFNNAYQEKKCVFCALPFPAGQLPSVHYAQCDRRPL